VAIEATSVVIQSLQIALYVDPSDAKAVEQSKRTVLAIFVVVGHVRVALNHWRIAMK